MDRRRCSRRVLSFSSLFLISLLILPAITSPSYAQGQTVFGPEEAQIGWWPAHFSLHTFGVDTPGDGRLIVQKITPQKRISGGFLFLNEQFIPLGDFLTGDGLVFEKDVQLRGTNYLLVFLRGKRGAAISIEVRSTEAPPPAPVVSFSAEPESILLGETSTLSWTTEHADTVTIDQGIGEVDTSGSFEVSPLVTTTYRLTATGPGGTGSAYVTVTVTIPPPTVSISATPDTILYGQSSTLSWTSANAESALIDQGIGEVPLEGSLVVSPQYPTTYTMTVTGPGGVASARVTVVVKADVKPQPEGSFGEGYEDLIPPDSTAGAYDPRRFSVITGLVKDQVGDPLSGVSVTILHHPAYGTAFTDAQGRYSIPVEGGAVMTVACEKEGLITAHRKVDVPWNDIAIAETMVMIPQNEKATTVTFDGNANTIVTHQSTEVVDEWGTRSCTMVFTGDNTAYLVDEDGNTLQELTTITTRATEFTTPESMPARLPPNSAYTYCVDLTVDGADRVKFQKPVITWVDNFLGFDVGMAVPVGTYDRDRGVWVPEKNAVVVKLLDTDTDGVVDALDANGDDQPDDLNNDDSFSDEVRGLSEAQTYQPGATLWRSEITHFSPRDWNLPFFFPWDAIGPNPLGEVLSFFGKIINKILKDEPCRKNDTGSLVKHSSRTFHDDISITGTEITLHYTSSRTDGYQHVITVPVSGDTVPASLKRIIVKVEVAGRTMEQELDPLPNQKVEFVWDGIDHLGRRVKGAITAYVDVGFVYDGVYSRPANVEFSFGLPGSTSTGVRARQEIVSWKRSELTLYRASGTIAEGWTLSLHHSLSLTDLSILHKGDGTIIQHNASIIDTIAGNGTQGKGGDGGPATEAQLTEPRDMIMDAAGNLYILEWRIRKVDTNGIITTVAGGGNPPDGLGDGGPATEAQLNYPYGMAMDERGNLYVADTMSHRIRKIDTNGIITTVAGSGSIGAYGGGFRGDGGSATEALLLKPLGVAVDVQGNLYIADAGNSRIRKVDTNGIITTIAGGGNPPDGLGDGGPATGARLDRPQDVAVDSEGNVYIVDCFNQRIRKIDTSGIITSVAGNGIRGYSGDGGPATQAQLNYPNDVAVDAEDNLYFADGFNYRIRKVDANGLITTVAGNGIEGYSGDGGPATQAGFRFVRGVTVDAEGNLYIADEDNHRIRMAALPAAFAKFITGVDIPFAEENGLGYIMASSGRHKQTIDLDTGVVLYEFGYDANKNLVSITDRFGNQTTIQRDGNGTSISITSPDGIITYLTVDDNNHLRTINYPDGSSYGFEYTPDGLMTAKTEPEGNRFEHIFNPNGRIIDATDEEGGHWRFSRTTYANGDILTEVLSAEGNKTSYLDHYYSTGAYTSTITDSTGAVIEHSRSDDGLSVNKKLPCGMEYAFKYGVDPEYKYQVVTGMWEDTPSGLERVTLRDKTYQDTNADKVPDWITEQVTVNNKTTTLLANTLSATSTLTSPVGRQVTTYYDPDTLLTTRLTIPGLYETNYGYDTKGRLTSIATNTRQTSFTYNSQGFLETITDPEGHTASYTYDPVGRMTGIQRPDGSSIGFTYDGNGNMTVLTTPSSIDHGFGYNRVNLNDTYQAPISGAYSYVYDRDRRLTQINFPSGFQIRNVYDKGRLLQIQTPEGDIDFTYYCGTMVSSITDGTETVTYGYDGQLVTSETLSGTLNQNLSYTYNKDFDLTSFSYAGGTTSYTYDNDGLLTKAGPFTITRNTQNGLPTGVTGGALNLTRSFNGYGEVDGQGFTVNGYNLTSWSLARDNAGRIVQRQETVAGTTSNYVYTYDPMGRLLTVTKNGMLVEEYQYGSNGARISEVNLLKGITTPKTYTYSDEDHLLTAGSTTYQYDADGFLLTKTKGTEVTEYSYSSRGELLQVKLPDGKMIEYLHDPMGRRIAKKVNGTITEKYLWQGLTRLLAVYDGSNNLVMRFEYTDSRMPLAMTSGGSAYYLTYDQVGSLRVVSDATGYSIKRVDYGSFGNIINNSNTSFDIPFAFAGGLHDRDTGLIRFGFRDYDPDIGRWTAKDPIFFDAGDVDLYGYCLNNSINCYDPAGLRTVITIQRESSTERSISSKLTVQSDRVSDGFSGYAVEPMRGGVDESKDPVKAGTYEAFLRTDHNPNRVELRNVPGYTHIQIHVGNDPIEESDGCFLVGTSRATDWVSNSVSAMKQIIHIIKRDGTGQIEVRVIDPPLTVCEMIRMGF